MISIQFVHLWVRFSAAKSSDHAILLGEEAANGQLAPNLNRRYYFEFVFVDACVCPRRWRKVSLFLLSLLLIGYYCDADIFAVVCTISAQPSKGQ